MKRVVFVSREKDQFAELERMLDRYQVTPEWTGTGNGLLSLLSNTPKGEWIDLLVMEAVLPDTDAVSLIKDIIPQSPMTNCVVAGTMENEKFHEAFEGYGVLMQIPPRPAAEEARRLESHLEKIGALATGRSITP